MESLRRKLNNRAEMRFAAAAARNTQALGRTTQAAHSTIAVGDVDIPLVETAEESRDTAADLPAVAAEVEVAADDAYEAAINVDEAHAAADQAVADALLAKQTADGKNSIYSQPITPVAHPDRPFKQSDVWYETQVVDGKTRIATVNVWDGSKWAPNALVGNSLLVPGSVGNVLIENGAITGVKIAATAIDGKTITGAVLRTAASGQRMQFDINGLRAYNAAGAVVATLQSDGGSLFVDGGMRASTNLMVGGLTGDSSRLNKDRLQLTQVSGSTTTRLTTISNSAGFEHVAGVNTPQSQSILSRSDQILMERYRTYPTDRQGRIQLTTYGAGDTAELTLESKETPSSPVRELRVGIMNGYYGVFVDGSIQQAMSFAPDGVKFLGDSDWVNLSLQSGFTFGANGKARARIKAGWMIVIFTNVRRSSGTGQANMLDISNIATPGEDIPGIPVNNASFFVQLTAAGTLRAAWGTGVDYSGNFSFPIA